MGVELEADHRSRDLFCVGRDAWPLIQLRADEFDAYVNAHASTSVPREKLYGGDLYLACALANSDPQAVKQFDRHYIGATYRLLRSRNFRHDEVDEVCQALRIKLLVGSPPKICSYRGHGPLLTWVLVTASRDAVKRRRRQRPPQSQPHLLDALVANVELDNDSMKRAYRRAFRRAFAIAVEELSARERTLLKLHTLEQLRLDEIGAIFGAHRATVARWLQKIRRHLYAKTRASLSSDLAMRLEDVDSIIGMISSRLDASVERLLRTPRSESARTPAHTA